MANGIYLDSRGRYRTRSLFVETNDGKGGDPVFRLEESTDSDLPCARTLYLEQRDVTEYKAAQAITGSWDHWENLCTRTWFKARVEQWRAELETLLRSEAVDTLMKQSTKNVVAAKYIANAEWHKVVKLEGAPKQQARNKKRASTSPEKNTGPTKINKDVKEDLARIRELNLH